MNRILEVDEYPNKDMYNFLLLLPRLESLYNNAIEYKPIMIDE